MALREEAGAPFPPADLARAARILAVRSRREAAGGLAGLYRSAFRGGGVEFEESRPYVPGDDVRSIDWNALARTGTPYVKRLREERDQTVRLLLDVSRSMAFGSVGRSKARAAAHACALVAAAAARAGDRVGLTSFDTRVRDEIAPARGSGHAWRLLRGLVAAAGRPAGGTDLAGLLAHLRRGRPRRSVVVLVSDFRDDRVFAALPRGAAADSTRSALVQLARHHDAVALVVYDPREEEIPSAGRLRLEDPERPGRTRVLRSGSARVRRRYREACEVRRRALVRRLRGDGLDAVLLRSDRDPLRVLVHAFGSHRVWRERRPA